MRVVVQKVKHASCTVDGKVTGSIQEGFLLLVGFHEMNLSLAQVHGDILSISQFTLYANCKKGNRPSFTDAAKPDISKPLYDRFNALMEEAGMHVEKGIFGADMKIELLNDGPITICLDSEELF